MTQPQEDFVGEFKNRYSGMKQTAGLVQRLGDRSNAGWSSARDALIATQFKGKPQPLIDSALADSTDDVVDGFAAAQLADSQAFAVQYFTDNKHNIISRLDASKLEAIALRIPAAPVPEDQPYAPFHNPATKIAAEYQDIAGKNAAFAHEEMPSREYRDHMVGLVEKNLKAVVGNSGATESSKKALLGAIRKLTKSSEGYAQAAGVIIENAKVKEFKDHFAKINSGENPANYTIADYARNTLEYSKIENAMPIVGEMLTAK